MTQPGIEPRSPRPLADTLPTRPNFLQLYMYLTSLYWFDTSSRKLNAQLGSKSLIVAYWPLTEPSEILYTGRTWENKKKQSRGWTWLGVMKWYMWCSHEIRAVLVLSPSQLATRRDTVSHGSAHFWNIKSSISFLICDYIFYNHKWENKVIFDVLYILYI